MPKCCFYSSQDFLRACGSERKECKTRWFILSDMYLVCELLSRLSFSLLASAESSEVFYRFGHSIAIQPKGDSTYKMAYIYHVSLNHIGFVHPSGQSPWSQDWLCYSFHHFAGHIQLITFRFSINFDVEKYLQINKYILQKAKHEHNFIQSMQHTDLVGDLRRFGTAGFGVGTRCCERNCCKQNESRCNLHYVGWVVLPICIYQRPRCNALQSQYSIWVMRQKSYLSQTVGFCNVIETIEADLGPNCIVVSS